MRPADRPDADGAALSREARQWWSTQWQGATFMAVGMRDPAPGPAAMAQLRKHIRNCPSPMELSDEGHFVQESGALIAKQALAAFSRQGV